MGMSRRAFIRAAGAASAGAATLPAWWPGWVESALAAAPARTTLRHTLVRGSALGSGTSRSYYGLVEAPGEAHVVRMDLIHSGGGALRRFGSRGRRSLLNFVHLTDARVVDSQS